MSYTADGNRVLIDLTAVPNNPPYPQSSDVDLCTLTLPEVNEGDECEMQVRESLAGEVVGKLTSKTGNFILDPANNTITPRLTDEVTRKWFGDDEIADPPIYTLTGTMLHRNAAGESYSFEPDIRFDFELSYTSSRP